MKQTVQDKLRQQAVKKFGTGAVLVEDEAKQLAAIPYGISCQSLMVNFAIGRPGFPSGRLTEIVGVESSSKSTLGYHIIAECQRKGGVAVLVESEEAYELDRLKKLGINTQELIVYHPKSMEEAIENMMHAVSEIRKDKGPDCPIVVVWDSVASTPTLAELESDYDDSQMASAARVLSRSVRKMVREVAEHKAVLIFMNQLKATLDPYSGEKFVSYGGKSLKFYSSIRLWMKTRKADMEYVKEKGSDPEALGTKVQVVNIKNKLNTPFKVTSYFLNFKKGIDQYRDCWDFGAKIGEFKEINKGRIHVGKKSLTRKKWKKFVKKKWGSVGECRDYLTNIAIEKGVLIPYGVDNRESRKKQKKGRKPRASKKNRNTKNKGIEE